MTEKAEAPFAAFGATLDSLIEEQGRSNKWLAERARVGHVQVSRWRKGWVLPEGLQLFLLSEALNADLSDYIPAGHTRQQDVIWCHSLYLLGSRLKAFAATGRGLSRDEVVELAELYRTATEPVADHEARLIDAAELSVPPGSSEAPPDAASG